MTQAIYDKIESGEYRVDGTWDGIKRGFYGGLAAGTRINNNFSRGSASNSVSRRNQNGATVNLVEGQPVERKLCC